MISDRQVKKLRTDLNGGMTLAKASVRSGMSEKTARKYRTMNQLPSETQRPHDWRTRTDPFESVWDDIEQQLQQSPGLQAKTIFQSLQRQHPGQFQDGQLRTLQRRLKQWRATDGPAKEIYFEQVHHPGDLCASDYTRMGSLGVTIAGQPFEHLLYHFVLTYSNWESVTLCYSESFESLSNGFQNAVSQLGAIPNRHRTDRLSAAVNNLSETRDFTSRYQGLMDHYGISMEKIQPRRANENGDVESSHRHLKKAIEQALLLRGSNDFETTQAYMRFVNQQVGLRNAGRSKRFAQEQQVMKQLHVRRLDAFTQQTVRVSRGSLIRVQNNTYSVHSRLIGEQVEVRIFADSIEVWYAQKKMETLARLRGNGKHQVNYRHVIDWLVRKPGAFKDYRYQADLFPSSSFRMVFDALNEQHAEHIATKLYLQILHLASRESETNVQWALQRWLDGELALDVDAIKAAVFAIGDAPAPAAGKIQIDSVDLSSFDALLSDVSLLQEPTPSEFISNPKMKDQHDKEVSYQAELESLQATGEAGIEHQSESRSTVEGIATAVVP